MRSAPGVFGRCVDDLALAMRCLAPPPPPPSPLDASSPPDDATPDPTIAPTGARPFSQEEYEGSRSGDENNDGGGDDGGWSGAARRRRLRVGFFARDGHFEPAPACVRAVEAAVATLRNVEGVDLVDLGKDEGGKGCVLAVEEGLLLALQAYGADGWRWLVAGLAGEKPCALYGDMLLLCALPAWLCRVAGWVLRKAGERRLGRIVGQFGSTPTTARRSFAEHL